MYDKTTPVRICSTIEKHKMFELQIQNRSATMLCANSTNVVLLYVERIYKKRTVVVHCWVSAPTVIARVNVQNCICFQSRLRSL